MISFFIEGTPVAQPRPKARVIQAKGARSKAFATIYTPDNGGIQAWKRCVTIFAHRARPVAPIEVPVEMELIFYMPRPQIHFTSKGILRPSAPEIHSTRPDFDNLAKPVADVLKLLGFYRDDGQIAHCSIWKFFGTQQGCMVTLHEMWPASRPLVRESDPNRNTRHPEFALTEVAPRRESAHDLSPESGSPFS